MDRDFAPSEEHAATADGFLRARVPVRRAAKRAARKPATPTVHRSSDSEPGYRRQRTAEGFDYLNVRGKLIKDARIIARILSIVIPPAWEDVWICTDPHGHLQATGRDARGRKQYRYHPSWREQRESEKFAKIAEFARALPRVRAAVERDLALEGLPREKVIAAIVRLLDRSLARIGGAEYARDNATYGLTTLCKRHVRLDDQSAMLRFKGKHGIKHEISVDDALVLAVVRECRQLPGRELFACVVDAESRRIDADDVNDYLQENGGCDITAKDFRTWGASVAALALLYDLDPPRSDRAARKTLAQTIRQVALLLRNTPAVCRRSYVHPWVVEAWQTATLGSKRFRASKAPLAPAERAFALLLKNRATRGMKSKCGVMMA